MDSPTLGPCDCGEKRKKRSGFPGAASWQQLVWPVQGSPSTESAVADFSNSSSGAVDVLDYGM